MYCVAGLRPLSVKTGLSCQVLLEPPGLPEVSVNKYCTPLGSDPVVAVMVMLEEFVAAGATAKVAGLGVGANVSPPETTSATTVPSGKV